MSDEFRVSSDQCSVRSGRPLPKVRLSLLTPHPKQCGWMTLGEVVFDHGKLMSCTIQKADVPAWRRMLVSVQAELQLIEMSESEGGAGEANG